MSPADTDDGAPGPPSEDVPHGHGPEAAASGETASGEEFPEGSVTDQELPEEDVPDATLGGYIEHHDRPPAFEGPDGEPYTVSPEVEKTADLAAPYHGYLVFPRWASTGLGVVDHVETPTLIEARTLDEARRYLGALRLREVKEHLDRAVAGPAAHTPAPPPGSSDPDSSASDPDPSAPDPSASDPSDPDPSASDPAADAP